MIPSWAAQEASPAPAVVAVAVDVAGEVALTAAADLGMPLAHRLLGCSWCAGFARSAVVASSAACIVVDGVDGVAVVAGDAGGVAGDAVDVHVDVAGVVDVGHACVSES